MRAPVLGGTLDKPFEQSFQFARLAIAPGIDNFDLMGIRKAVKPLDKGAAVLGNEDQNLAAVDPVGASVHQRLRCHAVDRLGQGWRVQQRGLGELTHRAAIVLGQDFENPPMFDRYALGTKFVVELLVDLSIRLSE